MTVASDLLERPSQVSSPLVRFEGVGKTFRNGTKALVGLDVGIGAGEFVSLLGPSGCGKSTALRLLAGLGRPSSGRIAWSEPPDRHDIGFVFQEPTLMPWASVARNVHLPLKLQGLRYRASMPRVEEALEMVGLEGFAASYPRELSGGMKMRVSIARALVTQPRILLMDEPFAALDEITRSRLNGDLLHLWTERRFTTVFVTHSVYESVFLSSRILVMAARPGRIVADLPVDAPFPRDEAFRMSESYNRHCRAVSAALRRAMEQ
ncbi:MAG TPA: ABC transporter ATP-binding protein [Geminicoccus sp.]|uniref:ABC transporter ATP-binding protein n=1 Tax=Geminicoccus sp. TaxID=2024832 RepID=UPI002E37066F|nr:ABC transporter ATP-binding protein [Geminicoccus sp.]HEX2527132.1 ABC transporter ATP-binding protein [Geminicoccus sp.]